MGLGHTAFLIVANAVAIKIVLRGLGVEISPGRPRGRPSAGVEKTDPPAVGPVTVEQQKRYPQKVEPAMGHHIQQDISRNTVLYLPLGGDMGIPVNI